MRIAMTLQHEWRIDSRVIREAEALVRVTAGVRGKDWYRTPF